MAVSIVLFAALVIFLLFLAAPQVLATIGAVILGIAIIILYAAASFFVAAALVWLICWSFSLTFSWKIAFGVYVIVLLISGIGIFN